MHTRSARKIADNKDNDNKRQDEIATKAYEKKHRQQERQRDQEEAIEEAAKAK